MGDYKVTATVSWDFETEEDPSEAVKKLLEQLPGLNRKIEFKLCPIKPKMEKIRLGEFSVSDIFPHLTRDEEKKLYEVNGVKYFVKMNSPRYFLFRECLTCVACKLKATRIFLECHPTDLTPHFNFYGEVGDKLILFTKDHIHAKSCGGEDRHSNYQTMCLICNGMKSHHNLTLDAIRELRALYDENKGKLTKKKLHDLMESAKEQRAKEWPPRVKKSKKNHSAGALLTNCDINLYKNNEGIIGRFVYDKIPQGASPCGAIKKGTFLTPMLAIGEEIMCDLGGNEVAIINQQLVR